MGWGPSQFGSQHCQLSSFFPNELLESLEDVFRQPPKYATLRNVSQQSSPHNNKADSSWLSYLT